jgi:hypothetical protein
MADYSTLNRGSEWHKWDLHFHTQSSHDYQDKSLKNEDIIAGLLGKEISAVVITDHHVIDTERIKNLQLLASDKLLVLPGIEFRSELGGSELMHFIGIFPETADLDYIWKQLQVKCKIDDADIKRKGGFEKIFCDFKETARYIHDLGGLVSVHAGKKSNSLERLKNDIKDDLEVNKCIDILEIGDEKDQEGYYKIVFPNIKRVIPIILCSDNHSIKSYSSKQNLWIKSDLTFEGLKQTLYEPEDRVKIQALKPDFKNERHLISEISFLNSSGLFSDQKILLNENLNAIIGGKSSGKSLLLFSIANSIDPHQVERTSKRLGFEGYKFDSDFDFKVTWKNGDGDLLSNTDPESKLHEITFIPQLYINHLVERDNKEELNSLIGNILLQDTPFRIFYVATKKEIFDTTSEIERLLNEYFTVRTKGQEAQLKSKDTGNSGGIKNSIKKIQEEILRGQKNSNLTEGEFTDYNKLLADKSKYDTELITIDLRLSVLGKVLVEIQSSKANLLGKTQAANQIYLKGQIDRILDELGEIPPEIKNIKAKLESDFDALIANYKAEVEKLELNNKRAKLIKTIEANSKTLEPYLKKIAGQKELKKLVAQLESENLKLQNAIALELQLKNLGQEYINIRKQISSLLQSRYEKYQQIEKRVNETRKNIGADIELKSSLIYKLNNFQLYEQANKTLLGNNHFLKSLIEGSLLKYESIPKFFANPLKITDDKLYYDKDEFIPLKGKMSFEEVLRGLVKDSFEIDYTVTYNGDNLLSMSPGKKGTVLLILFLEISSSEFPILIDQPEDNLDNRTIYDLLCKMIKEKKKDRQIIIVSHNANLVVATDTENIIVANQQGQESKVEPGRYRFEYVNGSLEHTSPKDDKIKSILTCQGIREHVCDILEGGGVAFKQRERKYSIKL